MLFSPILFTGLLIKSRF